MRTRRKRISACNARQRSGPLPGAGHFSVRPILKLGRSKFETVRPTYKMARSNRKTVWSNVNLVWIKSDFGLVVRLIRAKMEPEPRQFGAIYRDR